MDERLRFVARLLEGEKMAVLCREFDISRKTGYKIFSRYKDCGLEGLTDRSRRPYRQANRLPVQIEALIVHLKREHPSWGAPKIREKLRRRLNDLPHLPAISTVHAVLDRHGLVSRSRGRSARYKAQGTALSVPTAPNDLWCADYKGEFMLVDRRYCYPLTISDFASRYLLCCDAQSSTQMRYAFTVFERAFKDFGLPRAIRTDNGAPFASTSAFFGLSKLSVWWLRLGIAIERIRPGHPQQNGRHERMHLTLKKEATRPAAKNFLQQQARFDRFLHDFNHERPHQGLGMNTPLSSTAPPRAPIEGYLSFITRCTTVPSPSPIAGECASARARSTSARPSPVRPSGCAKSPTASGSSASCTTTSASSTTNPAASSAPRTPLRLKCYPCPRYKPLPM